MEWEDKKTPGNSTYKPIATSASMDWRCKSIHMALYEGHQTKDPSGRNIQVFRRRPKLLLSLHFFQCLYSSSSSHAGKLCPNAGIIIETKGQLHCQTYRQINTLLHRNKLCPFPRKKWSDWKASFSQSSYSSLISYLTSSLKTLFPL